MKKINKNQAKDYKTLLDYIIYCLGGIVTYNHCSEITSYIYDTLNEVD